MTETLIEGAGFSYRIEVDPASHLGRIITRSAKPYEAPLLEWLRGRGLSGVAVDAGAHIGNHALWLAIVCGLEVWAFEPLLFDELVANAALNSLEGQVFPIRCALGAQEGTASAQGITLTPGPGPIHVAPLDDWDLRDVRLIKADVEGMELDVLRGARETIKRDRPLLCIETATPDAAEALAAMLAPWGYRRAARFRRGTPVECWEAP